MLERLEDGKLAFDCPGCGMPHALPVGEGPRPRWGWNGSMDRPTFTPSILVRWFQISKEGRAMLERGEAPPTGNRYPGRDMICHSFVTNGQIQFLGDCTHALAGKTVPLFQGPPQ